MKAAYLLCGIACSALLLAAWLPAGAKERNLAVVLGEAGGAPRVTFLELPAEIVSGSLVPLLVGFESTAGKLQTIQFQESVGGGWHDLSQYDVRELAGNHKSGVLIMVASCQLLGGRERENVQHRIKLRNMAGGAGVPWVYSFECVKDRSHNIVGTVTSLGGGGRRLQDLRVESALPELSENADRTLRIECRSSAEIEFCRIMPGQTRRGKPFRVTARVKNLSGSTLERVHIVETIDRTLSGDCLNLGPGANCSLGYSARLP